MTGLKTLSSKLPCERREPMAVSLPITWTPTMVNDSHWVGFTFPGMIEEPGSFSGIVNSPSPQRGPDASQRTSLATLMQVAARRLQRTAGKDKFIVRGQSGKLVRRRVKRKPGQFRNLSRSAVAKLRMGVQSGSDRRSSDRQRIEARQRRFNALDVGIQKGHIAGEFLAQRERRGILQMRAPDLDDGSAKSPAFASSVWRRPRTAGNNLPTT